MEEGACLLETPAQQAEVWFCASPFFLMISRVRVQPAKMVVIETTSSVRQGACALLTEVRTNQSSRLDKTWWP